jgi:hypothetical protein
MKAMGEVLGKHFPGFVGTIYAMNFGWIYQGAWSVIKLLLSERARSKIQFCSAKELSSVIDTQHIPKGNTNLSLWKKTLNSKNRLKKENLSPWWTE